MDASQMLSYESYLKKQGLCSNTTSFYMRNLRAIYNQAVEQGLTPQTHRFARVYTGIAKTVISEAMGHSTQRTTYIYLKSFENTPVDRANRKVLSVIA